jgi:hypothetical protein
MVGFHVFEEDDSGADGQVLVRKTTNADMQRSLVTSLAKSSE